jgi:uronate dehydrogenase
MTETALRTIALTGAAGRIGRTLRPHLLPLCSELRLLDVAAVQSEDSRETALQLDLADREALQHALQGCEAVVHFAGYPREAGWDTLLAANVVGVVNLWEAAHAAGVQRIVYASSNHAVGLYPRSQKIDGAAPPLPDSRYGVSKVFMEALAAMYAIKHGVRGFGLRIGHCSPAPADARALSHWIHPEDLAQLVAVGLTADYVHEIVYGASANSRSWWSDERARALGYRPVHSADPYTAALEAVQSGDPVAEHFQGGSFAAAGFDNARTPVL